MGVFRFRVCKIAGAGFKERLRSPLKFVVVRKSDTIQVFFQLPEEMVIRWTPIGPVLRMVYIFLPKSTQLKRQSCSQHAAWHYRNAGSLLWSISRFLPFYCIPKFLRVPWYLSEFTSSPRGKKSNKVSPS